MRNICIYEKLTNNEEKGTYVNKEKLTFSINSRLKLFFFFLILQNLLFFKLEADFE